MTELLFIKIYFWVGIVGLILRIITIMSADFPIKKEITLGKEIGGFLILAPFVALAAWLIFK